MIMLREMEMFVIKVRDGSGQGRYDEFVRI